MTEHASLRKLDEDPVEIYARLRHLREGALCPDPDIAKLCWEEIDVLLDRLSAARSTSAASTTTAYR
jgi:hypothetical protein